jgi:hypothetical protein
MGSVRGKKTFRELPSTPLPIPYAMRSWNVSDTANSPNSRRTMEDTFLRPSQLSPISKITLSEYPRKSPEKQKKLSMLPGFQNAFETSTPMRSPSKRLNKGKEKVKDMDAAIINTAIIDDETEETPMLLDSIEDVNWKLEVCSSSRLFLR